MGQKKLLKNSLSLLVNRLTQGVATFVLTAAIARNLGAYVLGQYLLAISYYYIFVNFSSQGLKTFFTRELAREPEATPVYLVSGTLLQLIFSIIGYVAMVILVFLLPYNADTSRICYITGLTIVPFALSNITESIFQAQEKMHLIAISTVPIYILRLLAMLLAIQLHYGIEYVAGILVISESLITLIQWVILIKAVKPKWLINQNFIWKTIRASRTFFAIEGIGIIASKIDVLVLSLLGSEFLVGLYGAVVQLMQPFFIIVNSIILAAFPGMSKAVSLGRDKQREVTENVIEMLLCIGLPFLVGILFVGHELLIFIYQKQSFIDATVILHIVSLSIVAVIFAKVFSYLLIANGFEKFNLIEVVITTIIGGLTGIVLISQYKLLGAALMCLAMSSSNVAILTYAVYTRLFQLRLWRVMVRPLLISCCISMLFFIFQKLNLDFLLQLILVTSGYAVIVALLAINAFGGFRPLWQRIFRK